MPTVRCARPHAVEDVDNVQEVPASSICAAATPSNATACTPETPREKGSVEAAVRYLKSGFWPARCLARLTELDGQYADWHDGRANVRTHASGRFPVADASPSTRARSPGRVRSGRQVRAWR